MNNNQENQIEFLSNQNAYHAFLIAAFAIIPLETNEKYILLFFYMILTIKDVIKIKKTNRNYKGEQ